MCGSLQGGHAHVATSLGSGQTLTGQVLMCTEACWSQHTVIPWWSDNLMDIFPHPETPFYVAIAQHYLLFCHLMCEIKCGRWSQENAQSHSSVSFSPDSQRPSTTPGDLLRRSTILKQGSVPSVLCDRQIVHCSDPALLDFVGCWGAR